MSHRVLLATGVLARGGIGTQLLEACLAWLAEQNVDSILLWPSAASRSLYERHGFAVSDGVLVRSGSRGAASPAS